VPDSRDGSGRFPPGTSGNPGGKSKDREALRREVQNYLAEKCKTHVIAIEALADGAENEKVQLSARIWLAEQFLGKATQAISGPGGGPVALDLSRLSPEEIAILDEMRRRVTSE
jgi:hypothetical protein